MLASIQLIKNISPHPNADKLDIATVLGFNVVVRKDQFSEGEMVVFIQPDSILPEAPWTEPFTKQGQRVKALKLRGIYSFGIVMPLTLMAEYGALDSELFFVGQDVTSRLSITKYTPPPRQDEELKDGGLPFNMPKTDETLYKNLVDDLRFQAIMGSPVDVSLKVDGQSFTVFYDLATDTFGVTNRSAELVLEKENNYTRHIERYDLENKLRTYCQSHQVSLALRGESYGKGIQSMNKNPHSKMEHGLAFYSCMDLSTLEYFKPLEDHYYRNVCDELGLPMVPLIEENVTLTPELIASYEEAKNLDGKSFEGVVIVSYINGMSFKVINLYYDSKK
jgi:RNA ligase (TIGR02306 family)